MTSLFGFVYHERSLDYLQTLQQKTRKQIINKVQALASNPVPAHAKLVQGMTDGEERVYRIRSGDYRVLYVARKNPDHVVVLDIDHRKDVYR